jgi:hypothetical protein
VLANLAISLPTEQLAWGGDEARSFVRLQQNVGDVTGRSVAENVVFGDSLPEGGPADQIFVLDDCAGLYISTGEFDRPWVPLELRTVDLEFTINTPIDQLRRTPLITVGDAEPRSTISIEGGRNNRIRFRIGDDFLPTVGEWRRVKPGRTYEVSAAIDTGRHETLITLDGFEALWGWITAPGHTKVVNAAGADAPVTVTPDRVGKAPLCQKLAREARTG